MDTSKIRLLGDDVLVRQVAPKDTYGSGLIIRTQEATEWPPEAEVLAVGPGRGRYIRGELVRVPPLVKVGERIIFKRRPDTDLAVALDQYALPNTGETRGKERLLVLDGNPDDGKGDILAVIDP